MKKNIDKLNNEIRFYNSIIHEASKKYAYNENDTTEIIDNTNLTRTHNLQARIIIETMSWMVYGKKPKDLFMDDRSTSSIFNTLSEGLHFNYEIKNPITIYNKYLIHISNKILNDYQNKNLIINISPIINQYLDSKIEFVNSVKKGNYYYGIIIKDIPHLSFDEYTAYEVVNSSPENGYNQESKKVFFSKSNVLISKNVLYKFELEKINLKIGNEIISGDYSLIVNFENDKINLDKQTYLFSNLLNEFYFENKNHLHILEYLKNIWNYCKYFSEPEYFSEDNVVKKIVSIINNINNPKELMDNLISLKYHHVSKLKNFNHKYNPMQFEFWTKNPIKASLSIYDKEILSELIELSDVQFNKRFLHSKYNALLNIDFKKEKLYKKEIEVEHFKLIKQNENFYGDYDEYKILKNDNDETIFKWYQNVISTLDIFSNGEKNEIQKYLPHFSSIEDKGSINNIKKMLENKLTILFGHAGTGKTTLVSNLISLIKKEEDENSIVFIAPTLKAIKIISREILSEDKIFTVQKMLARKSNELVEKEFLKGIKTLIIDEISMIDDEYFHNLMYLLKSENCLERLILLGDMNQLSPINSIGMHMELKKNLGIDNFIFLQETHRQKGDLKKFVEKFLSEKKLHNDLTLAAEGETIKYYKNELDLFSQLKFISNDQPKTKFLVPYNYGIYGTKIMNSILKNGDISFNVGDQVIINETSQKYDQKRTIFKNRLLTIEKIENDIFTFDVKVRKLFVNDEFWLIEDSTKKLQYRLHEEQYMDSQNKTIPFSHANCITFHSSQGSGFESVVIIIPKSTKLKFEMLYTAISRVKNSEMKKLKIFIHLNDAEYYLEKLNSVYDQD